MKELNEYHVAGGFDEQHCALVTGNKELVNTLAQQIFKVHFTESIQGEITDELGFDPQQIRKQHDPLFRKDVLRAYNYQCTICGFSVRHDDITVALGAACIKWRQYGGSYEIPNGLALCIVCHKAFDRGSIGLDENMWVLVSNAVDGGGIVERLLWDSDGRTTALPQMRKDYPYEAFVE